MKKENNYLTYIVISSLVIICLICSWFYLKSYRKFDEATKEAIASKANYFTNTGESLEKMKKYYEIYKKSNFLIYSTYFYFHPENYKLYSTLERDIRYAAEYLQFNYAQEIIELDKDNFRLLQKNKLDEMDYEFSPESHFNQIIKKKLRSFYLSHQKQVIADRRKNFMVKLDKRIAAELAEDKAIRERQASFEPNYSSSSRGYSSYGNSNYSYSEMREIKRTMDCLENHTCQVKSIGGELYVVHD